MLLLEGPKFARFSFHPPSIGSVETQDTPFTILGHRIVLASSSDENRDPLNDESHTARTASSVWDCSIVLSKYMETLAVRHPGFWKSKRVLELGAGQGIVSLSAIALGAASVTITDLECNLPAIQDSIQLNHFPSESTIIYARPDDDISLDKVDGKESAQQSRSHNREAHATHVHLMPLDWVNHTRDLAEISATLQRVSELPIITRTTVSDQPTFPLDYILASDVIWVDYLIPSLVETMAALLGVSTPLPSQQSSEGTTSAQENQQQQQEEEQGQHHSTWPVILLAHQTRSTRGDAIFFDSLERFGLARKAIKLDGTNPYSPKPDEPGSELEDVFQDPLFRKPNITIWKIWRTK
ncbi:hypothetical protein BGW41_005394 [Actinomortierella wolfii]|nr:hypothetical protein BGW41_005394 [Actinomortierella wolfii]